MKTTKYLNGYRCDYKGITIVAPTRTEAMEIMFAGICDTIAENKRGDYA